VSSDARSSNTQPGRAPSIRDVARLAGVSHQTVSRVLNNHPSIREATKARVLQVMDDVQYRPNRAARALVTSKSRTIGILSAASGFHYGPTSSISAIEDAARNAGYYVTIANLDPVDEDSIAAALDHLMAQAVEGIVVVAPQTHVLNAITTRSLNVPSVTLHSTGSIGDHAMSVDQLAGARAATRHLIELGHRRIFALAGPQDWIEAEIRLRGFETEMTAAGLPTGTPVLGDWTAEFGYRTGQRLLASRDFTAVFSSNDQMALGFMHAIHDAGLSVPGDVSVVGFDDIPEAAHYWPPLTTVRQDFSELGRRSIGLLLSELAGDESARQESITPQLVVRSSTAPPRQL
jgi:DNA-binding LacI/PurR family transcriptional regulator